MVEYLYDLTYPYEQYICIYIYRGANGSIAPECQVETLCIDIYAW